MVLPNKFNAMLKTVSSLVAGIFLWNQIAWAGDLINTVLEQQYLEQSQTFAPDYLQNQQAAAESLINQQQANEDYMASQTATQTTSSGATQEEPLIELQGPVTGGTGSSATSLSTESTVNSSQPQIQNEPAIISVTTVDGDKINYKGAAIDSIEKKDGLILRNIVLDDANNLVAADIYHPDGAVQTVSNGRTLKIITGVGTTYNYNSEELIESVVYTDGRTIAYSYVKNDSGGIVETILTDSEKSCYYDSNNRLKKVLKNDGSSIEYQDGVLSRIIKPNNSKYVFAGKGVTSDTGAALISVKLDEYIDSGQNIYKYENDKLSYVQMADGNIFYYTEQGDITKRITPDGAVIEYQNGLIVKKTTADGVVSTYNREYDSTLEPFRLTIRDNSAYAQTYLCDNNGSLTGFGIDLNLPSATPFNKLKDQGISAQGYMQSSGVLAADGAYLYIKRWATNNGSDTFEKIGTGLNGTIAGNNYGTLSSSYTSYSATYYPDGNIYNPISSNAYSIERINVSTGLKSQVSVASGLIERSSGKVKTGYSLITSDGRYIYNVAYHIDNGSTTTYNGWTVKVFDPAANWQVVRTFTIATTSFAVNGLVSDGAYLYLIQWANSNSAKVAKISLTADSYIGTFTINQSTTGVIGGQYDWVNKKFWMGSSTRPDIYRYRPDEINYTPLTAANQELTFKAESVLNSSGVIATDGTYYYVKRWSTYVGTNTFSKIGTGLNGTIAGNNYGTLSSSYTSYSATYYPDGNIYNPISSNAYSIERINVSTGLKSQVSVASGLIERSSGKVKTGYSLITSDGRYIYNVAYHIDNGSTTTYNGWTVKVFDPAANWQVVKTFTVGASSFYTNGVVADGIYIYFIEWKESDSARITAARLSDGVIVKTWTVNQAQTKVVNGQYDWVNNKIVLGTLYNNSRVYVYDGLIQKTDIGSIDTDGFFGPSLYSSPQGAPSLSAIESDTEFKELVYSQDFKLNKAVKYDGSALSYENGLLKGAESASGIMSYDYVLNNSGGIDGFKVDREGIKRIYDKYGNLNQVSDGDLLLNVENNGVKSVQKEDGTIIEDAIFDSNNNIISAKITKPDGVVAVYSGGVLTEARQPDGSTFYYDASGNITKLVNSKGLTYLYSAIEEGGQTFTVANLEGADLIQDMEEIVYQKFDSNKKLIQAWRKNGTVLNYTYTFDGFGGITSTVISDGATITTYDKDNNIEKTEVLPAVEDPVSTISEYEYGRMRRVYKGNDLIYRYTYEFDGAGEEITVIEDIHTSDIKRYSNELLASVTDKGGLVTSYEYSADKKISKSTAVYLGKVINQYTYTYDGDNTIIEDIDGIKRTYDKDNKLAFLEEGGKTYSYIYTNDSAGTEISTQELVGIKDDSGTITNYKEGKIESIIKPDGMTLKDVVLADGKVASYTAEKDGASYYIAEGKVVKEIKNNGAIFEYYPDGRVKSITTTDGQVTAYEYEFDAGGATVYISAVREGIIYKFDKTGLINQVTYPDSQIIKYIYSGAEPRVLEKYELIKNAAHYFYDLSNRLIKVVDSYGREYDYAYTEESASVTSIYTSKYSSIEDIISYGKENLQFVGSGPAGYLEISQYADPNIPLLLHLDGANGSTQALDSSFAAHQIAFNGSARLDTANQKFGASSLYLDGNSSYLSVSDGPDFDFSTDDFTVDFWWNTTDVNVYQTFFMSSTNVHDWIGAVFHHSDNMIEFYIGGVTHKWYFDPSPNIWYHLAFVRDQNQLKIFSNGQPLTISYNSGISSANVACNGSVNMGYYVGAGNYLKGYMDEFRVTKGLARWTQAFPPPAEEYGSFYYDSGALISSAIELNATELNAISWNEITPGGTNITIQTRTGYTPDPDDGTWSGWSAEISDPAGSQILSPAAKFIQYKVNLKSQDPALTPRLMPDSNGTFVRIDYVENSSNIFNAAANGSDGNIELVSLNDVDVLRLTGYPDPAIPLLLHLDGANNSMQTIDSSANSHPVIFNGNARLDTSYKRFGASSLYLDGSGDYLTLPDSPDFDFGTGDFTVDFWFRPANISNEQGIFNMGGTGNLVIDFHFDINRLDIYLAGSNQNTNVSFSANTWYHLALVRAGGIVRVFVNGTKINNDWYNSGRINKNVIEIGRASPHYFNGWMDEARLSKGVARWTSNFTPPEEEFARLYKTGGFITSNPIPIVATEISGIIANVNEPAGTTVTLKTRTGLTANLDDGSWSQWIDATKNASGWTVNSPINKYLQYQLLMSTLDPAKTPSIYSDGEALVKIGYIYIKSFDAQAPPDDLVFKNLLTLAPPVIPQTLQIPGLKPDFTFFNTAAVEIESRILPDDTIIETKSFEEDAHDITTETHKDNKFTYYVDGKAHASYQKYDDNHLELLTQYSYDGEGRLILVRLPYARDSIEAQVTDAREKIAMERASFLRDLATQKGLAYTEIRDQAQVIRDQINAQRAQLQPMLYQQVTRSKWVGWWIFGWWETYTETVEVPEVRSALNQLNEQERQLNDEESKAYAALDSEVSAAEQKLVQDEGAALAEIANQEKAFQASILEEEVTPVIVEYYRSILGRDPDDAETESWLIRADYNSGFNANELKTALINSDEYYSQEAFVVSLKNKIRDSLYNYVDSDEAGKGSFLGTLGLVRQDAIGLTKKDADTVLSLLDKQNIHFGRSAFVALGTVLSNNGITYNLEDLALKTILIDIFTGSLNKFSEGTLLELSMYSLSKTAETYGVELNNTKLNYDELTQAFNSSGQVIAHLKNNHYVVVTNIAADGKISYVEHNRGQNGYSWTVSKEDFENSWTGYTIVQKTSAQGTIPESILAKKISDDTAMRVKGSCLPFLFPLLGMIFGAISGVATAVVGAIGAIVAGISAVIGPIIAGIGQLITGIAGFMTQIGGALFSAVQFVGTSLIPTIGGWIGGIGSWIGGIGSAIFGGSGLGSIISSTGFAIATKLGAALANTVVLTVLSYGITSGLDTIGINSPYITNFITGGLRGLLTGGGPIGFIIGGIQGIAMQGVNDLGAYLGISPTLTSVFSNVAGSFINAIGSSIQGVWVPIFENGIQIRSDFLTGLDALSYSLNTSIMPSFAGEMGFAGVDLISNLVGVPDSISSLIGSGIRSTLQTGLNQDRNPADIWSSVTTGLLQGAVSIGLSYATDNLGLSPLLANLGFSAISSVINAGIQTSTGGSQDVFKTIFESYEKNALTFLGYSDPNTPLSAWQQTAYLSQVIDFNNIVKERGLAEALNSYGAGFLNAVAVNNIVQAGYTLGGYFTDRLNSGQSTLRTLQDGKQVKQVAVKDAQGNTIANVFFEQKPDGTWTVVGKEEFAGNTTYLSWGKTGVDVYGKLGYTDADIYAMFGSDIQYQQVVGGQQAYVEIKDLQGNTILVIEPTEAGHYNIYNSYGDYVEAKISDVMKEYDYTFDSNNFFSYNYNINFASDTDFSWLNSNGLSIDDLSNFRVTETSNKTGTDQYTLEWKRANSEPIPSNWIEILKSPDAKERITNGFQGFGFVTNSDISQDFERKVALLNSVYDTGAVITVTGRGASANLIKTVSGGPWNHTAILYVDDNGTKWVFEEKGPTPSQGLRKVALDDWLAPYRAEVDNISIGKLSDPNISSDLKNTIERDLFYWEQDANGNMKVTGEVVPIPYDSLNLVGLHWSGYICSSLIVEIYKHAGHPLFDLYGTDWQYQYSPKNVYDRLKLLGHVD